MSQLAFEVPYSRTSDYAAFSRILPGREIVFNEIRKRLHLAPWIGYVTGDRLVADVARIVGEAQFGHLLRVAPRFPHGSPIRQTSLAAPQCFITPCPG